LQPAAAGLVIDPTQRTCCADRRTEAGYRCHREVVVAARRTAPWRWRKREEHRQQCSTLAIGSALRNDTTELRTGTDDAGLNWPDDPALRQPEELFEEPLRCPGARAAT